MWDALFAWFVPLYNLKSVKNTRGKRSLLVKMQAKACTFIKNNTPPWVFFTFFKIFTNDTKSRKVSHIFNQTTNKFHENEIKRSWIIAQEIIFTQVWHPTSKAKSHFTPFATWAPWLKAKKWFWKLAIHDFECFWNFHSNWSEKGRRLLERLFRY